MDTSYFTRAEFRDFAGDKGSTKRYSDPAIDGAQREVIERIEKWARSAWPTVPAVDPADGDGTAAAPREITQVFDGGRSLLTLARVPVISIVELTIDGNVIAVENYYPYLDQGQIAFGSALKRALRAISVRYRFGHTSTPWSVKRPAMQAAKSMLDQQGGRSRIPTNTSRYSTEGTSLEMGAEGTTFTRPEIPPAIFPWDMEASGALASYWSPDRPRVAGAI